MTSLGIPLGDRMKMYEDAYRIHLPIRLPMIVRVDGRAFHTFTKGLMRNEPLIQDGMTNVAIGLTKEISGAKIAYIQSDECSILITNDDTIATQPWFGNNLQKIASVAASIATIEFNRTLQGTFLFRNATFDARCFVLPESEVANYFIWRQQDAVRNSIQSLAQENFPHKQLQGLNNKELQELLWQEKKINWDDEKCWNKRGWTVTKERIDRLIPIFTQDRNYIERHLKHD